MKKMRVHFFRLKHMVFLLMVILVSPAINACQDAKQKLSPPEPFKIGVMIRHFNHAGRSVPVMIWYPASPAPSAKAFDYYGSVEGRAALEAPSDSSHGSYPLIIFSTGFSGCGMTSVFLTEHLAGLGYVVAAPDFKDAFFCSVEHGRVSDRYFISILGNSPQGAKARFKEVYALLRTQECFTYRTKEISATIDYLLEENQRSGLLRGMVDPSSIGVAGHSLGGWDALALGGVEICCDQSGDVAQDRRAAENGSVGLCTLDLYQGKATSLRDPRVKAVIAISPSVWAFPNNRGEAAVKIPTMIISGYRRDAKIEDVKDTYDHLPPPRYELILKGVDHLTASDLIRKMVLFRLVYIFSSGYIFHYPEKQEIFMNYSGNFFNAYLKNDPAGREYILAAHYKRVLLRAEE
jgi:predicted dienelactone hydrolase